MEQVFDGLLICAFVCWTQEVVSAGSERRGCESRNGGIGIIDDIYS